jgi:protein TonB
VVVRAAPPAPPPPPPAPSKARGAQPENQRSWQQRIMDNYPARAIRDEIEGRVGVRVTVGPNGRVSGCSVTSGSGSSILDDAACQDITRYGRFSPALDDDGNPTTGSWGTTIVYQLGR